jgi:hypothetical protein
MPMEPAARKSIKDVFYETRVLMGREYTLRRFATDVLGGTVDPVMLGYIEKGKRFPTEALVRRLAAVRKEDPHGLLALLWRDRILHAFGRELKRVLQAPRAVSGIEDAELAVLVSQAIAALPDDGSPITIAAWRKAFKRVPGRRAERVAVSDETAAKVEKTLIDRKLAEIEGGKVRRLQRHYRPESTEEKQALAMEFCTLFAKGLLDQLVLLDQNTGTYLRNHFLNIDPERIKEFRDRLDEALRRLAEEFAADPSAQTRLFNVLVTATPF